MTSVTYYRPSTLQYGMPARLLSQISRRFGFDAHYFVTNSFWLVANQVISLIGSLVTTIIFAHYLGEELFGNYRYLITLTTIFAVFSLNSIGQSILQTAAKGFIGYYRQATRLAFYSGLGTSVVAGATGTYYLTNGNDLLAWSCFAIALLQPAITATFNFFSLLTGSKRFRESSIFQTFRITFISLASIVAIFLSHSVLVLFVVYLLSQLCTNLIGHWYYCPPRTAPALKATETATYHRFALHQSIQAALLTIAQRLDAIIIFQTLGGAPLAAYTIALIAPEQLRSLVKNFSNLLFPKYVHYTPTQLRSSIPKRSLQLFCVLLAIALLYIIAAPFIFAVAFPKYVAYTSYSQIMALSIPAAVFYVIQSALKTAIDTKALYSIQLLVAVIRSGSTFFLTLTFGIPGAVAAFTLTAYCETGIYYGWYFWRQS